MQNAYSSCLNTLPDIYVLLLQLHEYIIWHSYIYMILNKMREEGDHFIHDKIVYVPYDLYAQRNGKQLI